MPNKRDPNKVSIGIYIDRDTRDLVKEILNEKGLTLTDYIHIQLLKLLKKEEDDIIKTIKKSDGRRKDSIRSENKKNRKK
jgi:antitoxin component of RelBE/YafQ-DinJ toxin-antitoxin module